MEAEILSSIRLKLQNSKWNGASIKRKVLYSIFKKINLYLSKYWSMPDYGSMLLQVQIRSFYSQCMLQILLFTTNYMNTLIFLYSLLTVTNKKKKQVYEMFILFRIFKTKCLIFTSHNTSGMLIKVTSTSNFQTDYKQYQRCTNFWGRSNILVTVLKWWMVADIQKT